LKRIEIWAAILLNVLGLFLGLTVHLRLWQAFDLETLLALQGTLPRVLDVPFSLFTLLGSAELTVALVFAIAFFAQRSRRLPLILSLGLATLIEFIGKTVINQPTTPDYLVRYVSLVPLASGIINPGFSFPSGHAIRTTFIVVVLAPMIANSRLRRATKIALYVLLLAIELVMLVSRVYLAEHWTTDVIGGALLGAAFGLVALIGEIRLPQSRERNLF